MKGGDRGKDLLWLAAGAGQHIVLAMQRSWPLFESTLSLLHLANYSIYSFLNIYFIIYPGFHFQCTLYDPSEAIG